MAERTTHRSDEERFRDYLGNIFGSIMESITTVKEVYGNCYVQIEYHSEPDFSKRQQGMVVTRQTGEITVRVLRADPESREENAGRLAR